MTIIVDWDLKHQTKQTKQRLLQQGQHDLEPRGRNTRQGKPLLNFSLTVKEATLIFISGCGSAISSAKEGKSGFIYNLVKTCVHFMKIITVYTLNSYLLTLKAHNYKMYVFVVH